MAEYSIEVSETESLLSQSINGENDNEDNHKYVPKRQIPIDRCYAVYFIFLFLGIASLLPWNFFITAKQYFQYKLRNTSLSSSEKFDDPNHLTELQILLLSYMAISATMANLLCLCGTALLVRIISLKKRVVLSLSVIIVVFGITATLVKVNSDEWQTAFFAVTMISAAVINGATAVMSGSVFGLVCRFPPLYTQSVMTGQAVGGTFAALASIFSIMGGNSVVSSAFGYFLTATLICVIAMIAYGLLYYFEFSKYYITDTREDVMNSQDEGPKYMQHLGHVEFYTSIVKQIWRQGLGVCLVFTVTLSVFPSVCSAIQSQYFSPGDPWSDKYFTAVVCFLFFNLSDWVGRPMSGWIQQPSYRHQNCLFLFCVLRIIMIPLLMFCNAKPRTLPVWFVSDAFPIAFIILLGVTNGYFGTLNMMYAPQRVPLGQAEGAGVLMSVMLTLGLALGSGLSFLLVKLL